jgi:hypothetical protein
VSSLGLSNHPKARALEGAYALAMKACREGEAIAARCGDKSRPFEKLIDEIALKAARDGSVAGFDGRYIYVRSAGEEAWLGAFFFDIFFCRKVWSFSDRSR